MASRRREQAVGDLVAGALSDLGVPSARVTARLRGAWEQASDAAWRAEARLQRLQGGVLEVAVRSAALRQELAQFHASRLLATLRAALPDLPLVGVRFVPEPSPEAAR